jgi:hypothetical protein
MKARLCLVASALLLASPALAQEPLETIGTENQQKSDQAAPATDQAAPPAAGQAAPVTEQAAPAATEPAPAPNQEAAAPKSEEAAPAMIVFTELSEVDDSKKLVQPWGLPADAVEEMDVYDANGNQIGEVDAVLQDKNGEIKGVAVGYGGFLGFGEKGAIVTLDQLKLKDGTLITELTEDQLSQQPEWKK